MTNIYIAVSGVMGSGKTTLSRLIASYYGWKYIPESRSALHRITELFNSPSEFAFEVQTSFLVDKATQLSAAINTSPGVVLDRSIYEDIEVFARYFYEAGHISKEAYKVYMDLALYFERVLPAPDIIIYCECAIETIKNRISNRERVQKIEYPENHLEDIYRLYGQWKNDYKRGHMYSINTDEYDTRKKSVLKNVVASVERIIEDYSVYGTQQNLFSDHVHSTNKIDYLREVHSSSEKFMKKVTRIHYTGTKISKYPIAYIAAPFSEYAVGDGEKHNSLIRPVSYHGILPEGEYRNYLLEIEESLRKYGIYSFIPHRDINDWGNKQLTAENIMSACTNMVYQCDLLIGVLGRSVGSHYEFGLALGYKKPCIIIRSEVIGSSIFVEGVNSNIGDVITLDHPKGVDFESVFRNSRVREYLEKYIPLQRR